MRLAGFTGAVTKLLGCAKHNIGSMLMMVRSANSRIFDRIHVAVTLAFMSNSRNGLDQPCYREVIACVKHRAPQYTPVQGSPSVLYPETLRCRRGNSEMARRSRLKTGAEPFRSKRLKNR